MVAEPVKLSTPVNRSALAASGRLTIATNPSAKILFVIETLRKLTSRYLLMVNLV
jgi:hypothetical protein